MSPWLYLLHEFCIKYAHRSSRKTLKKSGAIPDRQETLVLLESAACQLRVHLLEMERYHHLTPKRRDLAQPTHFDCRRWPTLPTLTGLTHRKWRMILGYRNSSGSTLRSNFVIFMDLPPGATIMRC